MQTSLWRWVFLVLVVGLATEGLLAQGKLVGPDEPEFKGSYMEDQVMTYFNPDNDYAGPYLNAEAQKVAAYVVEKSRDLDKVLKQLSVSVMNMRARYPGDRAKEYQRRLQPFLTALNEELSKKNVEVKDARLRITFLIAGGLGIAAGTMAFLWFGKEKKPVLKRRLKRAACYGVVGCLCGVGLGMAMSSLYGKTYPAVDESRLLILPPDDPADKDLP